MVLPPDFRIRPRDETVSDRPRSAMLGDSGYARREHDAYWTEPWVTEALLKHVRLRGAVWEPACGRGDMVQVLKRHGYLVVASDIYDHGFLASEPNAACLDFLEQSQAPIHVARIMTNPPYGANGRLAERFVEHALDLMRPIKGLVAMLLRHEFDCASSRDRLFDGTLGPLALRLTLTKRPRWDWWERDKPKAGPRHNYAWFVWDFEHEGPAAAVRGR